MDLHDAANKGNLHRVKTFVEQGVDKDECDSEGWTPLLLASFNNHIDVVHYLVEKGAAVDKDSTNAIHSTPLCTAAHHGHLEVARILLENGADKDKHSVGGNHPPYHDMRLNDTPLSYAVRRNHIEIAKLLMKFGADLDCRYLHDAHPILIATSEEMRQAVRDEPERRRAPGGCANMNLYDAARYGDADRVRFLHQQGAAHDTVDSDGLTPLWWASSNGHLDMVTNVVEQGSSLEAADNPTGTTMLGNATRSGRLATVRYLLEQGADRDKGDIDGYTPLHWAAISGQLEIAMLLMRYGADLNAMNDSGESPIDLAVRFGNEDIRQSILDEPRRRMDEAPGKRATEQDRQPDAATQHLDEEEQEGGA